MPAFKLLIADSSRMIQSFLYCSRAILLPVVRSRRNKENHLLRFADNQPGIAVLNSAVRCCRHPYRKSGFRFVPFHDYPVSIQRIQTVTPRSRPDSGTHIFSGTSVIRRFCIRKGISVQHDVQPDCPRPAAFQPYNHHLIRKADKHFPFITYPILYMYNPQDPIFQIQIRFVILPSDSGNQPMGKADC